jgi:hypothetical protein
MALSFNRATCGDDLGGFAGQPLDPHVAQDTDAAARAAHEDVQMLAAQDRNMTVVGQPLQPSLHVPLPKFPPHTEDAAAAAAAAEEEAKLLAAEDADLDAEQLKLKRRLKMLKGSREVWERNRAGRCQVLCSL